MGPGTDRTVLLLVAAVALTLACAIPVPAGRPANPDGAQLMAGVARIGITPAQPVWMAGYAARKKPSEGTAQELHAKVLALSDGSGGRLVVITSDLLGFPASVAEPAAERLAERYGLRRDQVLFTSSHTHSGPVVRDSLAVAYDLSPEQVAAVRSYTEWLKGRLEQAVGLALSSMKPADLRLGRGSAAFGVNRRQKKESGFVIGLNPGGPVDHEVTVLTVGNPGTAPAAVLFSYACHNTTLGADNYRFHGDYAGIAQEELEKALPGTVALFMIGCAADTNPDPRGTMELAAEHGRALASAVQKALSGDLRRLRGPLATRFERVRLPFSPAPSRAELEARLADRDVYRQRNARALLEIVAEKGSLPDHYPYPIQVARLGDGLTLVALAGEVVVDYNLRLKRELAPADGLWVVGYANDVFAYIPSKRVLEEGGYEADTSMIYYGLYGPWDPSVEELIVGKVREMCGRDGNSRRREK